MTLNNLLTALPPCDPASAERIDELLSRPGIRVERIVSSGQASPPGFWYDQAEGEWIMLLSGAAALRFEHEHHTRLLAPGDCLDIPPHDRHRVEWTAPGTATIWLAVFYSSSTPWPV
ncbi:cupin [Pseudomonas putida S12]|jgi:cupin 2 domain-containing protein|uniref:Cupin n=1 Tax=Pseudomonas putida S12 TaxID=1215087 RepID=A0AA34RY27_PSEPU|nr:MULTISPECIES: cupin domain-containing protein [Pseudomonas]AJA15634.1 cupin [Pseudomonas putida S12]TFW36324.1 cupin [Pseudomonas putida]USX35912.1 cupin [Pseudomonas putida]